MPFIRRVGSGTTKHDMERDDMTYFKIISEQAQDMGIYEGDDPEDALDAMAADGGIPDGQVGSIHEWIIRQPRPEELLQSVVDDSAPDIAGVIREAREQLGWTQVELGKALGLSTTADGNRCPAVELWETQHRSDPGLDSIRAIGELADAIREVRRLHDEIDLEIVRERMLE